METVKHPSPLELERLLAEEPSSHVTRAHVQSCAACGVRLEEMRAEAARFAGSPHSVAARSGYARVDRRWRRNAMLAALVPVAAAALAATAAFVPFKPSPTPNALIASMQVGTTPQKPVPLRTISLRGTPVAFGEGMLEGVPKEGPARPFVLKHTDVQAEVTGFVSSVTVTQEFENPFSVPVEAVYVFPLPEDAAVNEMVLTAGGRVTRATVQKREDARRRYEQAKSEGRNAALLDQERPNIFTQSVANLLPRETVKVTLTYVARVRYDDGAFVFNFPMVVGPRYIPGKAVPGEAQGTGTARDTTDVLDASRISPPLERSGRDVSFTLRLDAGGPIEALSSGSHHLFVQADSKSSLKVTLDPADRIPNRDLVFRWKVAGPSRRAALVSTGGEGGTFALMLMPPAPEVTVDPVPKEMIFVIDTSCSMAGPPLNAAKRAMQSAMEQMNPADTFMLIDFADNASSFHASPLLATPQNVQRAIGYLNALPASGGTNQLAGLGKALTQPEDVERLRMVLLMTDGFIGNETQILAAVEQHLGKARIFGFGVGTSVNHFLLARLSETGRGFYQYVRPGEDPEPAVAQFVRRLEKPLLTDVELDWGSLQVQGVMPKKVPDLFDAQPIFVVGRNLNAGKHTVTVRGKIRGVKVEQQVDVVIAPQRSGAKGLPSIWARQQIEDLDRQQHGREKAEIVEAITVLGLEHHLVTAYTSLVAIGEEKVAPANPAVTVPVGQQRPAFTYKAVPKQPHGGGKAGEVDGRFGDLDEGEGVFDAALSAGDATGAIALKRKSGADTGTVVANPEPPARPKPSAAYDDEFSMEFGGGERKRATADGTPKRGGGYIPPAPGSASNDVRGSLGPADIFEVVTSNRAALAKCVEEQRKRDPGLSGKLVMRWQILPSGKTTLIFVVSEEFKATYVAGCIGGLIKTWTFPKHEVQGDPVVFPFKF